MFLLNLRYKFILLLTVVMSSCSENSVLGLDAEVDQGDCSKENLIDASNMFLEHLLSDDLDAALQFYSERHQTTGADYGINYTFFPSRDPDAVFDIQTKNSQSEIFSKDLGVFEKGRLVGFFQIKAKVKLRILNI